MTKILTFKKRKDFLRVAQGSYVVAHNVILQAALSLSTPDVFQIGYTATKKIGNAVIRNKSKRRLRAIAHDVLLKFGKQGIDYVFIARNSTYSCDFLELKQDVIYALKRINKNFIQQNADNEPLIIEDAHD